jgi:hypothetical protein
MSLELHDVLYVPGLTKNLLLASTMIDLKCVAKFDDQQVIIRNCSHEHGQILAKGMQEGRLYRLLIVLMKHDALVHDSDKLFELWHKSTMEHFYS